MEVFQGVHPISKPLAISFYHLDTKDFLLVGCQPFRHPLNKIALIETNDF
jgi:hypothetical protein